MLSLTATQVLYLGFVGTVLNVICQVPQMILTFSNKNLDAISLTTNIIILVSQFIWILYGYYIQSVPVIVSSSIIGVLCSIIIVRVLYIRNDNNISNDIHSPSMIDDFQI